MSGTDVDPFEIETYSKKGISLLIQTSCERKYDECGVDVDVDVGMCWAKRSRGLIVDDDSNRRLLRKADLHICSLMAWVYAIQYMDKQTASYSSIMGLLEDLSMTKSQYSWLSSAFYIGYLVFEVPASLALQRFPLSKVISVFIVLWGIIICATSTCQNYASFLTLRVILGIFESAVNPCFMLLTSQWYKREEQLFRVAIWTASAGLGTIIGSVVAYALEVRSDSLPMSPWRLLYVVLGAVTIVLGLVFCLQVPDDPGKAWFLCENDKLLVAERIRSNKQGFGNNHFKLYQLKEVFSDIRTYIYFAVMIATEIPNGGIGSFGSIMLKNMDYDSSEALLRGTPFGAVEFGGIILVCWIAQCTQQRILCAVFSYCLNIISGCLLAFGTNTKCQLAGYYLQGMAVTGWICFISCVTSNTAGHTKKVVTSAICMIGYCIGNLIGPQTFRNEQQPGYHGAKVAIVVCFSVCLVLTILLYFINFRENRRRDALKEILEVENSEFNDLTDFENPEFRYAM